MRYTRRRRGSMRAAIHEIFESIQGEGILVGVRQLFIRFAGCNLSCSYCDTPAARTATSTCIDRVTGEILKNPVSAAHVQSLVDRSRVHSICFTGGEPLLHADFISSLEKTKPFYLETNMSLPEQAKKLRFVDYVAGDLKIREAGNPNHDELLERTVECFRILRNEKRRLTFCKIVLPSNFDAEEVENAAALIKDYVCCFVLQPVFGVRLDEILKLQERLMDVGDVRLIPQVHKYLGVR